MNTNNWALTIFTVIIWYGFIYVLLYSLKNSVNLYYYAGILIVLASVGTVYCPWFRETAAFKKITKK